MSNSIKFILNSSVFQFPCSRKLLVKIPESKEDLFNELFIRHEYHVLSQVRNEIFQLFLKYWKEGSFPRIDSTNIIEYFQLSQEFGLLDDYFTSQKLKEPLFNLNYFINPTKNSSPVKTTIEKNIALSLDEYLNNFSDKLALIDIQSLYNIFYHPERRLDDHDKAYKFIVDNAADRSKDMVVLIASLDMRKFKDKENIKDASVKVNEHAGFYPQNVYSIISELEGVNDKLQVNVRNLEGQLKSAEDKNRKSEGQLKSAEDKNRKLEGQLRSAEEQNRKLEGQLKSAEDQYREESRIRRINNLSFAYTGSVQQATLIAGTYKLEVWGAQGGNSKNYQGGKGGYSTGLITLKDETTLFVYVGGKGDDAFIGKSGGWNGGGDFNNRYGIGDYSCGGGGATDISLHGTNGSQDWNNTNHLYSRIIVAGGGSGVGGANSCDGGFGGGESGGGTLPASQTGPGNNGSFGIGANEEGEGGRPDGAAGGGWYGGGSFGLSKYSNPSGGGSGYVYTSSTQSNYPSGCLLNSSYYLTDASTKGGNKSFPNFAGSGNETGHCGNGAAKITLLSF